jgi:diguanylate cyclase (GGDEF)-like protein
VAEKIRHGISGAPLAIDGRETRLTVSLGVGNLPEDANSVDGLIEAADRDLYRAKAAGRNRVGASGAPPAG